MNRQRWLSLASPLLLLIVWELAVVAGWLNRVFYPPPSEVFGTLVELVRSGQIVRAVGASLFRIGVGFVLGCVPAVVLGLIMGINPAVRALIQPLASAIYPIPKIALLPLIVVALGLGEGSKIATIAISVFFMVVLNVAASVMQVDAHHFEVARSFGARPRHLFWTVALPASLPGIMASIKLGMGFALTLIIGVEFVGASEGIGWLIWQAYEVYAIDRMLAGLVVIAIVGWLITIALDELENWLLPWRRKGVQRRERRMRRLGQIWWPTIRPWSYTAAVIPVLLGASVAAYDQALDWWLLVLCLAGSIAIQAGTNLVNEYFDDRKGIDKVQVYGIGGAIQRGELQPWHVLLAGGLAFAIGSAIGLYLVSVAGAFIFWLGLASVLVGILYTAGPFPLAYIGLGEIAVFTFMGPVIVSGSYYVQVGAVTWPVLLASLPVGFLVAAILHANNLRDLDIDRQFGKRTLATLLGRSGANVEYYVLIGATYVSLAITVVVGIAPILTLITLITLPTAVRLMRIVATEDQPQTLQPVLRQTARLHMQFGCLFIVGWIAALLLNGLATV
ncbi:MAG: 1,4-dihydroxy-2-naphthoate polyprenyltransferase [uncultured Chloroflexia bacterium]|uniref:1,4-dihydroxy-2-naphthoate octaprenyltransferase n=1 Tax=uncultured Chloroflexia bacterium TaxID=1672391 RepID=A0A6J4K5F6_9CHLR|nr:MAG: 1,4-dihydroxy-2-naphthoate polyprenyltransferase [uncultured Chloroflexia bacterium]